MSVNKKEFADRMAAKGGIKKKDAMKGLNLFIETLMDCMSENEKVKLLNFGRQRTSIQFAERPRH